MAGIRSNNARSLAKAWNLDVLHALYRKTGDWYHQLERFPGAFLDENGYVIFETAEAYRSCPELRIRQDVTVPKGISAIPGYTLASEVGSDPAHDEPPTAIDIDVPPDRKDTTTSRIIRDSALARRIKRIHNYECQLCGHTILLADGSRYAEAHHIRPLGGSHNGLDIPENLVCVCPNHHAELDFGARSLDLAQLRKVLGHTVAEIHIDYHNAHVHRKS